MQQLYQMLRQTSRTFALSIEQLPRILRDAGAVAYLLLRVSDCLEDHDSLPVPRKIELLYIWAEVLAGASAVESLTTRIAGLDGSDPEVNVAQNAGMLLQQLHTLPPELQEIITRRARETTLGMARWQAHGPYVEDEAALDDYMHEVAGRVGYLLTELFAWYVPAIARVKDELMPLARESGLALQTVNIIRGLRKDYERGWVFVPQTFYESVGLTQDSFFDPANLDRAMQVVALLADKADRHLQSSLRYVVTFPRRYHSIRLAAAWPFLLAVKTLAVSRDNVNVLLGEAKITRDQVKEILLYTKMFGWSNHWLRWYYNSLARV